MMSVPKRSTKPLRKTMFSNKKHVTWKRRSKQRHQAVLEAKLEHLEKRKRGPVKYNSGVQLQAPKQNGFVYTAAAECLRRTSSAETWITFERHSEKSVMRIINSNPSRDRRHEGKTLKFNEMLKLKAEKAQEEAIKEKLFKTI